jgi:hypothetical protein
LPRTAKKFDFLGASSQNTSVDPLVALAKYSAYAQFFPDADNPEENLELAGESDEYEISSNAVVLYSPKAGGEYVMDKKGDFVKRTLTRQEKVKIRNGDGEIEYEEDESAADGWARDEDGAKIPKTETVKTQQVVYVHLSQLYQPKAEAQHELGVIQTLLAVAFQCTQIQMSQVNSYITELFELSAQLDYLRELYERCTVIQTNMVLSNEWSTDIVNVSFLTELEKLGIIDETDKFFTGVYVPEFKLSGTASLFGVANKWSIASFYEPWLLSYIPYTMRLDGEKLSVEKIRIDKGKVIAGLITNREDIIKILSVDECQLEFEFPFPWMFYDIDDWEIDWEFGKTSDKGDMGSFYHGIGSDHASIFLSVIPSKLMSGQKESLAEIRASEKDEVFLALRDVRRYGDSIRIEIERLSNKLQVPNNYIAMVNTNMQNVFEMASNVLSEVEAKWNQTTRNLRV